MAKARRLQTGVSLLLFLFLAVGITLTLGLSIANSSRERLAQEARTQVALQEAKEAIIAWSVSRGVPGATGFPGQLPCPEDTSLIGSANEGQADSSCTQSTPTIGRLPWRTLGLVNPKDANGEQLWYILSPGFRTSPPNTTVGVPVGQLQLDSLTPNTVAIVIAPGASLPGQSRNAISSSAPPSAINYLDSGNATGPSFFSTGPTTSFNDRVLAITAQELIQALSFRILAETRGAFGVQNGLRRYYNDNGFFPPNGTALNTLIFDNSTQSWLNPSTNPNKWFSLVTYTYVSPTAARISIAGKLMNVIPCATTPCP